MNPRKSRFAPFCFRSSTRVLSRLISSPIQVSNFALDKPLQLRTHRSRQHDKIIGVAHQLGLGPVGRSVGPAKHLIETSASTGSPAREKSDSRPGPPPGLCFPLRRWSLSRPPRRVSQVPRLICPRALSPTTPEGLAAALAPYFTASVRLHPRGRTGHLQEPLTRPNRVHLLYGSRVRFARLRQTNCFASRSLGYLSNGQLQGKLLSAYKISQALSGTPPWGAT